MAACPFSLRTHHALPLDLALRLQVVDRAADVYASHDPVLRPPATPPSLSRRAYASWAVGCGLRAARPYLDSPSPLIKKYLPVSVPFVVDTVVDAADDLDAGEGRAARAALEAGAGAGAALEAGAALDEGAAVDAPDEDPVDVVALRAALFVLVVLVLVVLVLVLVVLVLVLVLVLVVALPALPAFDLPAAFVAFVVDILASSMSSMSSMQTRHEEKRERRG